eukprot:COSAG02_NODE_384_length_23406_cov_9.459733_6_plen_69_part_00
MYFVVSEEQVTAISGDPAKALTWDCSGVGTVFGEATDVTPPLTCLGHEYHRFPNHDGPRGLDASFEHN